MTLDNINTYGELLQEIERIEKTIKKLKQEPHYEQGDDIDLQLYLIQLKKIKSKNEQKYKMLQDFGLYECSNCGSIRIDVTSNYELRLCQYNVIVECQDCNYKEHKTISKQELKDYISPENEFEYLWRKKLLGGLNGKRVFDKYCDNR